MSVSVSPQAAMGPKLLGGLALVLALWLGWQAWVRNLDEACRLNEWPYLARCAAQHDAPPAAQAAALLQRLADNPGDSSAAVALAVLASEQPDGRVANVNADAALDAALKAAPQNGAVLSLQASRALRQQQWTQALDPLIRLTQFHQSNAAASLIGQLMANAAQAPGLQQALEAAAQADGRWLARVIYQMPKDKIPVAHAMPAVAQAMAHGRLDTALGRFLIQRLKADGQWLEAYGVWQHLWNRPLALLFNGDFEQAFLPGGFDWEPGQNNAHRAGAQVMRAGRSDRGQVLQVSFTGRPMAAYVVRQDMLLTPGSYRFSGDYRVSDLRSQQGLAWVFACASGNREIARTAPMLPEGRNWQSQTLDFTVPPDCGLGVTLSLRTQAPYEATAGMRGDALFDRLRLERREGGSPP